MEHSLAVADTMFQHKAAHLQTWYSPNPADTTQHQIDHTIIRRRDSKCILDTRVYRGVDVDSDHRLMVSKLRLKFRKPSKPTQHRRLHPGLLLTEKGQATFQQAMQQPLSVHAQIPINDVDHSWQVLRSSLSTAGETLLRQPKLRTAKPTNHGSLRLPCSLPATSISCGRLGRPATLQKPRPHTSQPTEQHGSLGLLTISNTAPQNWLRCSTACAKVIFTQHTSASTSSANRSLRPSLLCGNKAQADCYSQLRSALLSGPVIAQACSQQKPPSPPQSLHSFPAQPHHPLPPPPTLPRPPTLNPALRKLSKPSSA